MALIRMDYMANTIQRWTTSEIWIPDDVRRGEKLKTLVLLHGYGGNHTDWSVYSNAVRYAAKYRAALLMPDGENSYFLNFPERAENFEDYIAEELLSLMRNTFPLSDRREDTFVAGLSMGGGAAIRMGLRRGEVFSKAAGLSAGITVGEEARQVGHGCDMNEVLETALADGKPVASLYMSIGTEDPLLEVNRNFHLRLTEAGIAHRYEEAPGTHNWDFWDGHIEDVLRFVTEGGK